MIERAEGARYVIDKKSHVCMLMIDHAIATRVDCATLRKNVKGAGAHTTWLMPVAIVRKPRDDAQATRWDARWTAAFDAGLKKTGAHSYSIDSALVNKLLESPVQSVRGARFVPSVRNGKPDGVKLYAIRPSSIYAKLGLRNGDTIQTINGYAVTASPDKPLELYSRIKSASVLIVGLRRRGTGLTMTYSIVK